MKKLILSLCLLATAYSANAATIVLQSGSPVQTFKTSGGADLDPLSHSIVLGFFRNYTVAMNPSLADPNPTIRQFIAENFVPIGTQSSDVDYGNSAPSNPIRLLAGGGGTTAVGTIENSTWLAPGGPVVANSEQPGGLVRGTKIFMLAMNATDLASASDLGIYSATTWTLPASTLVNAANLSLSVIDTAPEVFRGSIGSLILGPIVPEPSTGLLALIAGCGLISRRRR